MGRLIMEGANAMQLADQADRRAIPICAGLAYQR